MRMGGEFAYYGNIDNVMDILDLFKHQNQERVY